MITSRRVRDAVPVIPAEHVEAITEIPLTPIPHERFRAVLTPEAFERFDAVARRGRDVIGDERTVWMVNSTAAGGGVAELLHTMLPYVLGAGVRTRWMVIGGSPAFFAITKRIHNFIHGARGDGGHLSVVERRVYEATTSAAADALAELLAPGDVVVLHDPQTAGMVPRLAQTAAHVVWRSHVGDDRPGRESSRAWAFLTPYLGEAEGYVFSRAAYVPEGVDVSRVQIIKPSIDPFSAKNREMGRDVAQAILQRAGLATADRPAGAAVFERESGGLQEVTREAEVLRSAAPPVLGRDRIVTQISRWDPLKDHLGVMTGFVEHVLPAHADVHLVLAGPPVHSVSDDPEAAETYRAVAERWRALAPGARRHVHLANLPMHDRQENAAIVNALQRESAVVVQKSMHEGFGLTVTEAMWKARPIIASAVGGITDQIADGVSGLLIADPADLRALGAALNRLLDDPIEAAALGSAARETVRDHLLHDRHLADYLRLVDQLVARER